MTGSARWTRRLLFVAIAAWMLGGPIHRQVFDGDNQHLREWRMYGTRGGRVCRVLFEQQTPQGWERVSRWEIEGFDRDPWPPADRRMLDKKRDAVRAGTRLCDRLGSDTVLRYRRRCGHVRRGWSAWEVSEDLCGDR